MQISRGVNIAGQTLTIDPRTGETVNGGPFSRAAWLEPAKPHTVSIQSADGTTCSLTIIGATHAELRDDAFIHALVAGKRPTRMITEKMWHGFVTRLAKKYPDKVKRQDGIRPAIPRNPRLRVIVSTRSASRS